MKTLPRTGDKYDRGRSGFWPLLWVSIGTGVIVTVVALLMGVR